MYDYSQTKVEESNARFVKTGFESVSIIQGGTPVGMLASCLVSKLNNASQERVCIGVFITIRVQHPVHS